MWQLTCNIDEGEKFTKEISVGPEVVLFQIGVQIVNEQFLLQLLVSLGLDSHIEIHPQGQNLPGLPVLPQPARDIEDHTLEDKISDLLKFTVLCMQ